MAMSLRRLACLIGHHHRNQRRARPHGSDASSRFVAPCTHCGTPMIKDGASWRRMTREERHTLQDDVPKRR